MDGVPLAARFSIATNRLRYCGPAEAAPDLYRAITDGTSLEAAARHLSRFEALYPYLEAIGRRHGLSPFSREVVEAYWIGNRLLDPFGPEEFRAILGSLAHRGLPPVIARELSEALPPRPIPHHAFHVAFVGVGAVTGHVPTTVANIESCRPVPATVTAVRADSLTVETTPWELGPEGLRTGASRRQDVAFDRRCLPSTEAGASVALHWGWAAAELTAEERRRLESFTAESLRQANQAHARLGPRSGLRAESAG